MALRSICKRQKRYRVENNNKLLDLETHQIVAYLNQTGTVRHLKQNGPVRLNVRRCPTAENHLHRLPRRARAPVFCQDYRCSHNVTLSGDRWPDDIRLSDIEDQFICTACGKRGAEIRGDPDWDKPGDQNS
jgi:hypothetical protein